LFKPAFNKMAALGWLGRWFPVAQPIGDAANFSSRTK
jgi:hypothetical protein